MAQPLLPLRRAGGSAADLELWGAEHEAFLGADAQPSALRGQHGLRRRWTRAALALATLGCCGAAALSDGGFRRNVSHSFADAAAAVGLALMVASPNRLPPAFTVTAASVEDFTKAAFPEKLGVLDAFRRWQPHFEGGDLDELHHRTLDCRSPYPSIYFNNPKSASYPLFHNEQTSFPMAMDYSDSSFVAYPASGTVQTVLGFAEMQWPYYHHVNGGNLTVDEDSPYLVISMNAFTYTEALNSKFAECGLLGWPGVSKFKTGEFPLRVVLKNGEHGADCAGWERGHARCDLATSWGHEPTANNWRNTAKEIGELIQLCTFKYVCDIQEVHMSPSADGKATPQVFLFRVIRKHEHWPTTTTTRTSSQSTALNDAALAGGPPPAWIRDEIRRVRAQSGESAVEAAEALEKAAAGGGGSTTTAAPTTSAAAWPTTLSGGGPPVTTTLEATTTTTTSTETAATTTTAQENAMKAAFEVAKAMVSGGFGMVAKTASSTVTSTSTETTSTSTETTSTSTVTETQTTTMTSTTATYTGTTTSTRTATTTSTTYTGTTTTTTTWTTTTHTFTTTTVTATTTTTVTFTTTVARWFGPATSTRTTTSTTATSTTRTTTSVTATTTTATTTTQTTTSVTSTTRTVTTTSPSTSTITTTTTVTTTTLPPTTTAAQILFPEFGAAGSVHSQDAMTSLLS